MAKRKRKRSLAKSKQAEFRRRSKAAKRGWIIRRKKEKAKLRDWVKVGSPIIPKLGPHKRNALTKDFDDLTDFERLALTAKSEYPDTKRISFSLRLRFIPDVDSPDEYTDRWVSIPFDHRWARQVRNGKDYLQWYLSGAKNYGLVIPIEVMIMVQE